MKIIINECDTSLIYKFHKCANILRNYGINFDIFYDRPFGKSFNFIQCKRNNVPKLYTYFVMWYILNLIILSIKDTRIKTIIR